MADHGMASNSQRNARLPSPNAARGGRFTANLAALRILLPVPCSTDKHMLWRARIFVPVPTSAGRSLLPPSAVASPHQATRTSRCSRTNAVPEGRPCRRIMGPRQGPVCGGWGPPFIGRLKGQAPAHIHDIFSPCPGNNMLPTATGSPIHGSGRAGLGSSAATNTATCSLGGSAASVTWLGLGLQRRRHGSHRARLGSNALVGVSAPGFPGAPLAAATERRLAGPRHPRGGARRYFRKVTSCVDHHRRPGRRLLRAPAASARQPRVRCHQSDSGVPTATWRRRSAVQSSSSYCMMSAPWRRYAAAEGADAQAGEEHTQVGSVRSGSVRFRSVRVRVRS
jgi:hypothetical protein